MILNFTKVSLALDSNNKFIGLKVNTLAALGAYISTGGSSPPTANLGGLAGVYTTSDSLHYYSTFLSPKRHASDKELISNT